MRRALLCLIGLGALLAVLPAVAQAQFGFKAGTVRAVFENEDGTIDAQASSHPYAYTIGFALNTNGVGVTEGGELRDVLFALPTGLSGNPFAVPRCARQEFEGSQPNCPPNTQVGIVHANIPGIGLVSGPIYNLVPPPGMAAQLGFSAAGLNALPNISVRSEEGYGLLATTNGIPLEATSVEATVWGTPAEEGHDDQRGPAAAAGHGGSVAYVGPELPFLALPATCEAPLETTISVDSKLAPGDFVSETVKSLDAGGDPAPLQGCGAVPFSPSIFATLSASAASSSSGLDFRLALPNEGFLNPHGILETEPEKTEVTLPAGIAANAAAAAGLGACSEQQFKAASPTDPGCPAVAKIGTLFAKTPLLEEPIEGSVYVATPLANRFGTLISLYIVAAVPERGVLVKQAGRVDIDPQSGQLTATFDGLPPIPYSSFVFRLREGARGALTTPTLCGKYTATARLYPFSDPDTATVRTAPFTISTGAGGGTCASSEAALPNSPGFGAGTIAPLAGAYSPLLLKLSREEGTQRFGSLQVSLPLGLTGKLADTTECPEAAIAQAEGRKNPGEGALEQQSPSCPASSQIGTVTVGAGSGSPLYVTGRIYLAGPYKGAPLSIAIITPAIAGPFDLGTVVVRSALLVDETTAKITASSDPIPMILQGIPLDVRSVAVQVDRREFTLNPTSCETKSFGGTLISTAAQAAPLAARFQVGGCKGLEFKPQTKLRFKGGTTRTRHPALKAVVTYPSGSGYANIAKAAVTLPHSEIIDPEHIGLPCTRPQFAEEKCPKISVLGRAKVWTPLLAKPLEGKVYFRANGGERAIPDMVVDLRGQIHFVLIGAVDTVNPKTNPRIRTTFFQAPDAPISRFELELKGGKEGVLVNSENLCHSDQRAKARYLAQNGLVSVTEPKIANGCPKKGK